MVVHVRGLVDGVTEADLVEGLQEFGTIRYEMELIGMEKGLNSQCVKKKKRGTQNTMRCRCTLGIHFDSRPCVALVCSYVVVMPKKRQALVEYEDMNGSSTAVTYAADNPVYIAGHPAFINYSTSQKISRPGDSDDSRSVNNVLLLTIMNPIYPITTVNASVCSF